ncbi:MAG TPA: PAS domain S-box protein [Bacteroidales bacterium]|nr:PAS domain S-box protein [Bacteroidales bacterium]
MTPFYGKWYRFERYITSVVIFIIIFTLGFLIINILSEILKDGVRDFIVEQDNWAKNQKAATINLVYYMRSRDPAKYRNYKKAMNKLLNEKKDLLKNNFVKVKSLNTPLLGSLTECHFRDMKIFYTLYLSPTWSLYLPRIDLFEQSFTTRQNMERMLGRLQVLGRRIISTYQNQTLSSAKKRQYLLRLYSTDAQLASSPHQFIYEMSILSKSLQRYTLFNLIGIGLVVLLTGGITSYYYLRNSKYWQEQFIKQNDEPLLIFANTVEGILLVKKGGKILNSSAFANELLLNSSYNDLKGRNIYDVLQVKNEASDFSGKIQRHRSFRKSITISREDGTEIIANISVSTIQKETGETLYCLAIKDETETMRYINQLKASKKTYRDLLNNVRDAIFIHDNNGVIIQANTSAARIFGYDENEFVGKMPKEVLASQSLEQYKPELFKQAFNGEQIIFDRWAQKKNGTIFPIEITLSKSKFFGKDVVISIIRDISERHDSIKELQKANKRNQVLLQELHHRVKNNMALISGLFDLQLFDVDDPNVQSILGKSQKRIHAIADVHEFLYQSNDLVSLDFKSYLDSFIKNFKTNAIFNHSMDIHVNSPSFILNVNQAMPAALLLNEILLNIEERSSSLTDKREITIDIEISRDMVYTDIKESPNSTAHIGNSQPSLGWDIIRSLIRQLDAKLEMSMSDGQSHFKIQFKRKKNLNGSNGNLSLN